VKKGPSTGNDPIVTMETSRGVIKFQVFRTETPITAGNFVDLVKNGFYNGLSFHRYEPGFLVQGGDPKGTGFGLLVDSRTREERKIPLEVKPTLRHELGSLCMSHAVNDPNSGSCQFYISLAPQAKLDMQYAVFGRVIDGLPVVSNLRAGDKIIRATVQEPGVK
jgi:cyclophilin family peptidyl-prolyl cis-trans isomerase